jgi:hypothetical protein
MARDCSRTCREGYGEVIWGLVVNPEEEHALGREACHIATPLVNDR